MIVGSFAALAAETPTEPDNYQNEGAPYKGDTGYDTEWAGANDGSISVGGLNVGDTVKFYRVLEFDADSPKTVAASAAKTENGSDWSGGGWTLIAPFTTGTGEGQITLADFKEILTVGISSSLAGKIAKLVDNTPDYSPEVATGKDSVTVNPAQDGLYVAIVVPKDAGWIYNPIFVASDYYTTTGGDKSSTWTAAVEPLSYSDRAMAKKAPITITKEATEHAEDDNEKLPADPNAANDAKGVAVGDVIDYTITTTIPEFADNYTDPKFVITDTMVGGLDLVDKSIKVYLDDATDPLDASGHFTLTPATDKHSYTIAFDPAYLLTLDHNTDLKVTYQATVTTDAVTNVHEEDNTVELEYSHEPSVHHDGTGKKVKDKTHHYTWTIDGQIWGNSSWRTIETVKVGLDKDGNEIKKVVKIQNGYDIGALAGAKFKLYIDAKCEHEYTKGLYGEKREIISDANGYLNIKDSTGISGLDAGTYYLKETEAPAGYIKQQEAVKIEIIPTYYTEEISWVDSDGCTIKCNDLLKSYIVKIDGVQTAGYTLNYTNMSNGVPTNDEMPSTGELTTKGEGGTGTIVIGNNGPIDISETPEEIALDEAGKIKNTQGVELPSTGGMGTTILYVGGSILVILAAILLITKRRMSADE